MAGDRREGSQGGASARVHTRAITQEFNTNGVVTVLSG